MKAQWLNSRNVKERIYLSGSLVLKTPAHFGNGDTDSLTDIPLMLDAYDGKTPLLTGTSIAGALRNYLRELQLGYGVAEKGAGDLMAERLFGHIRKTGKGDQSVLSWLMVDDARGTLPEIEPQKGAPIEIRDGVAIDARTRTVKMNNRNGEEYGQKFDIELLAAGTTFDLHFEFWLTESNFDYLEAMALALDGFEQGRIGLGGRKSRGYGQCRVTGWKVKSCKMNQIDDVLRWLEHRNLDDVTEERTIFDALDIQPQRNHAGKSFQLEATFRLEDALLIRSSTGKPAGADFVHLRSLRQNGNGASAETPVLSGTSLAGVIRSRALRIAKTVKGDNLANELVDGMFGRQIQSSKDEPTASRVIVSETEIDNSVENLVQTRIKIDRFTGGAFHNALFSEQPVFAKPSSKTHIKVKLELRKIPAAKSSFKAEVGLLLLVLKDLWTGDLPLGGASSVGHGRLQGLDAELRLNGKKWVINRQPDGALDFTGNGKKDDLQTRYLNAFLEM